MQQERDNIFEQNSSAQIDEMMPEGQLSEAMADDELGEGEGADELFEHFAITVDKGQKMLRLESIWLTVWSTARATAYRQQPTVETSW